jgi:peptide deformylase
MDILQPPLKIVHYPHPSLRHVAKPLTAIDRKVHLVAGAMLELMYEHRGLGLAAPQVGMPFRMFVANYEADSTIKEAEGVYINPVIIERHGRIESDEGCLSFPELYRKVGRAKTVKVQAYNLKGELVEIVAHDLAARIWQHETDHLDGVLFIDKVGMIGKMRLAMDLAHFESEHKRAQRKGELAPDAELQKRLVELETLA